MKIFFLLFAFVFTLTTFQSSLFAYPMKPNSEWTFGSVCSTSNKDYAGKRYPEKISYCNRNVSFAQKAQIYNLYKIPESDRHNYTIDHLIPLSIGGDNSPENLWPEHVKVKALRPQLESILYQELSQGQISQREAIETVIFEKTKYKKKIDVIMGIGPSI